MAIGDLLSRTPLGGISGAGILNFIGQIAIFVIVGGLIVLIIWWAMRRRSYNIISPVLSERTGSLRYFTDLGSYSKDKKTNLWDYRFKRLKEKVMPPPDKVMITGPKGANVAFWYQGSAGEIYPAEVTIDKPEEFEEVEVKVKQADGTIQLVKQKVAKLQMRVIEPDIALWSVEMDDRLMKAYGHQTWWDKYGNYIMFFGTAALTLVLIYLVLKKIDVVQEAARLFGEAAQTLKASGVATPSPAP